MHAMRTCACACVRAEESFEFDECLSSIVIVYLSRRDSSEQYSCEETRIYSNGSPFLRDVEWVIRRCACAHTVLYIICMYCISACARSWRAHMCMTCAGSTHISHTTTARRYYISEHSQYSIIITFIISIYLYEDLTWYIYIYIWHCCYSSPGHYLS